MKILLIPYCDTVHLLIKYRANLVKKLNKAKMLSKNTEANVLKPTIVHSFNFSNHFILGTLGAKQEYTLDRKPVHHRTPFYIHVGGMSSLHFALKLKKKNETLA